jgi:hypothetical protein
MKKLNIKVLVLIATIIGNSPFVSGQTDSTINYLLGAYNIPKGSKSSKADCDSLLSNIITPGDAAKFMADFMKDDTCSDFSRMYGIGGFIGLGSIREARRPGNEANNKSKLVPPYFGFTIFPCIDLRTIRKDKLFFAMKADTVCPGSSDPNLFIRPLDRFVESSIWFGTFNKELEDSARMLNYLRTEFTVKNAGNIETDILPGREVIICNYDYKDAMKDYPNFADYGFGFIPDSTISEFINQDPSVVGFCVFLGFTKENKEEKVRMVLIAVNSSGKLLMDHNNNNNICLEKSWPPIRRDNNKK